MLSDEEDGVPVRLDDDDGSVGWEVVDQEVECWEVGGDRSDASEYPASATTRNHLLDGVERVVEEGRSSMPSPHVGGFSCRSESKRQEDCEVGGDDCAGKGVHHPCSTDSVEFVGEHSKLRW